MRWFSFQETTKPPSKVAAHFSFLRAIREPLSCFTSSLALGEVRVLDLSCSNSCVVSDMLF